MKKRLIPLASAVLIAALLSACGENTENKIEKENGAADTKVNDMINSE